jgi:amino acid transporter
MSDITDEVAPGLQQSARLRREGGIIGLLFASTTSIIGSGWLFGAFHASKIAGPLAIWSWVAGAIIILLIALCFAELGALFPRAGALVHMSHASHGAGLGRIWTWILFLCYPPVAAVEAEAVVTYANNYLPYFIQHGSNGLLTPIGFAFSVVLLAVFAALNLLTVGLLLSINTGITWWKIAVPALTGIALLVASHNTANLSADPTGYTFSGIFSALPAAGIIFSYLGFRTAIDLGGESANPHRDIPLAVIGSVVISAVIYILLQFAFLLALRPSDMAHGWAHLSFAGQTGPFAGLAAGLGLGWLAALLYIDAYVSPGGTGLISTGGARILYAAGETRCGPHWLTRLTAASQVPWLAVLCAWLVGILFLLPYPAWQLMVQYITSITVLTYGLGPVVLLVLRRNLPEGHRRFSLWGASFIAPVAFVCSNLVIYWTGLRTNSFLFGLVAVGFILYVIYHLLIARLPSKEIGWRHISWLLPWFAGMWVLSWLSDIGGGAGIVGFWGGVVLTIIWSLIVLRLAMATALSPEETHAVMARMNAT